MPGQDGTAVADCPDGGGEPVDGPRLRGEGDLDALRALADLPLFGRGPARKVRNVMTGRFGGRDVTFRDYVYTLDAGEDSTTYRQSVALFPGTALPDLTLEPETVLDRIASAFAAQDIGFDSSPEFSKACRLSGPDESAIRSAFGAEPLAFFAAEGHWRVEVRGGTAGAYSQGRLCRPHEAELCLTELVAVVRVLARD
jgi:hypothetical protein